MTPICPSSLMRMGTLRVIALLQEKVQLRRMFLHIIRAIKMFVNMRVARVVRAVRVIKVLRV